MIRSIQLRGPKLLLLLQGVLFWSLFFCLIEIAGLLCALLSLASYHVCSRSLSRVGCVLSGVWHYCCRFQSAVVTRVRHSKLARSLLFVHSLEFWVFGC